MVSEKRESPTHKHKPKDTRQTEPPKGGDPKEEMRLSPPAFADPFSQGEVPLIPCDVLFGNPEVSGVTLSPDGKQIAFLAPHRGVLNLWVQELVAGSKPRLLTNIPLGLLVGVLMGDI